MPDPDSPKASSAAAQSRMRATRQRGTKAEMHLRSALHRRGLRYRVQRSILPDARRKVDIVFPRERVAIFVDGCFWHGCPVHGTWPKQNAAYWQAKINRNKRRDRDTDERLQNAGWHVIRFWEHEHFEQAAEKIDAIISKLRREGRVPTDPQP